MVPKPDSGTFLLLFLLVLTLTEPLRPGPRIALARLQSELRCTPVQFACHNGAIQCIPLNWQCDGWPTCEDESDEVNCPGLSGDQRIYHGKEGVETRHGRVRNGEAPRFHTVNFAQPVRFSSFLGKCPSGWHHYDGTASCYKVYSSGENYWDAVQTCQKVNGSLATFTTDSELKFILAQEWDMEDRPFLRKDQRRLWVGYQFVITSRNHSVEGHWEVAYKGSSEVFLPPVPIFGTAMSENENILCAQLQYFHLPSLRHHGLHSWYAENCYEKSSFLCKRSQTCVDIKDNIVDEGYYFTPKGDDPCLSCTCHNGEPEMCVAALCEKPQGCQQYRKDPKECCKFTCLDPDGSSLFDSMASGMRLIVSCISSFLILSLLLFMVHRLRQRRRERIESLIGANLHHFNLGRRMPGFEYGPDGFGTGLTPLHLSDDGEGGAFHFHEPPPPYTAYKYSDIQHPDDPPPPYEASICPDIILCSTTVKTISKPALRNYMEPPSEHMHIDKRRLQIDCKRSRDAKRMRKKGQWCYSSQNPACGPDHWKDINHNCEGDHQSPINIEKAKAKKDSHLGDITFKGYDHAPSAEWKLMNDGHSVILSLSGDISISGAGLPNTYRALQFHFHWGSPTKDGSEHTVDGKQFPLELHIVHMNDKYSSVTEAKKDPQGLAVLGILITVGETENPSYSSLVSAMKNISLEGDYVLLTPTFPLESLLPAHEKLSSYYRYQGSLTTPDCSQAVIWTVFEQPVTISKTQHQILTDTAHFSAQGETLVKMKDNFRPPQPLKGRQVWASRDATVSCSSVLGAPVLTLCMISLTARILLS